jgi:hypothetical protein
MTVILAEVRDGWDVVIFDAEADSQHRGVFYQWVARREDLIFTGAIDSFLYELLDDPVHTVMANSVIPSQQKLEDFNDRYEKAKLEPPRAKKVRP